MLVSLGAWIERQRAAKLAERTTNIFRFHAREDRVLISQQLLRNKRSQVAFRFTALPSG